MFFKDQTPQNFLLRKLKLSVLFMRHLVASIPVVASSLQEVICNIFLEEYLVRGTKGSRMSRLD